METLWYRKHIVYVFALNKKEKLMIQIQSGVATNQGS